MARQPAVTRDEKLAALRDGLWGKTGRDWILEVSAVLTEPVCPSASVRPEGSNETRYTFVADTVEEALDGAVDLAYRGEILGEKVRGNLPFTNPDDHPERPRPPFGDLASPEGGNRLLRAAIELDRGAPGEHAAEVADQLAALAGRAESLLPAEREIVSRVFGLDGGGLDPAAARAALLAAEAQIRQGERAGLSTVLRIHEQHLGRRRRHARR